MDPWTLHFPVLVVAFLVAYFAIMLPLFQRLSVARRGRRFVVRLGTPWNFGDPEHRHDVVMSFASFMAALALAGTTVELAMSLGYLPELPRR